MSRLSIIFEDTDLLVINKPAGIVVNKSDTTQHVSTVQDVVAKYLELPIHTLIEQRVEGEWETPESAFQNRSGIAHRLDKETSGILLIAKTLPAFIELQRQFKEHVVEKTYIALSHGKIVPIEGEISVPVGRLNFNRKRFGVVAGGRESVTQYRVIAYYKHQTQSKQVEDFSLVELYPKTGRTHQIRVHLQYIGHPIFGDELYAGRKVSKQDRKIVPRVFLHAAGISFVHPTKDTKVHFEAPLPEELTGVLDHLQLANSETLRYDK